MDHKWKNKDLTEAEEKAYKSVHTCKGCGVERKQSKSLKTYSYQKTKLDHSFKEPDCVKA